MATMNEEIRTALLDRVERNWEREVEFLRGMVRRPSTLGNEALVQRYVAWELEEMGLEPDVWTVDPASISRLPGYSPVEWSYEGRPNVAATLKGSGGGRSLALNGHVDVVPATPEHHWTYDPWGAEVSDGRMYGRGAADMKAGIAAMIYAVRAISEEGIALKGDVSLETVIEEECTGNGALSARARGYAADAAIIPEPFAQTALEAQVGVMWARVTVRGRGAHAERASAAVNAITKATLLIEAVKELEAEANAAERPVYFARHEHPLNYNVGRIRGGDWTSSVPEECAFEVRLSCYPGEDLREVQDRFRSRLLAAAKEDPWLAENPPEVVFYAFQAEGCSVSREEAIFSALGAQHRSVTGDELGFYSFTGTTDVRFFNLYYDTPATCYGPAGGNLHAPDEWVDLESVRSVTGVLALSIVEWCGVADV
jgi:acetylornithine deacetylase